jgi:hypothetical protein
MRMAHLHPFRRRTCNHSRGGGRHGFDWGKRWHGKEDVHASLTAPLASTQRQQAQEGFKPFAAAPLVPLSGTAGHKAPVARALGAADGPPRISGVSGARITR